MENKKFGWPWVCFFLVLILASPLIEGGETFHTVIWLRLWVIGFGLNFFLSGIRDGRLDLTLPRGNWMLIGLGLLLSLSLFTTHYYYITVYWYCNFLVYFLLGYLCLGVFSSPEGKRLLPVVCLIMVLAGLTESVYGVFKYSRPHTGQVSGTFFNPAFYTGYLTGLISFALAGALFPVLPGASKGRGILTRAGLATAFLVMLLAMVVSGSRAIIFAAAPIGLIFLARFRVKGLAVLAALTLAIIFIPNPLNRRFEELKTRDPFAWERVTIWKSSLNMIRHHPAGVGLGMYQYYYDRYAYPIKSMKIGRFGKKGTFAHNDYLNLAAESSPLAPGLALAWLGVVLFPGLAILFKRGERNREWVMLLAFSGSLLGILGHSLVDTPLRQPPVAILATVDLGAILALGSGLTRKPARLVGYPLMHPRFIKFFLLVSGLLIGATMTYQALIFGAYDKAQKMTGIEQRIEYLTRLSDLPAGYAPLYFQIALDNKNLFLVSQKPEFLIASLKFFEPAARLNPENHMYFYHWADSLYQAGMRVESRQLLDETEKIALQSLERSDKYPLTYLMLANIAHLKKDYGQEEKWLNRVLLVEPYYFLARAVLAELYVDEGKLDQAESQLILLKRQKQEVEGMLKEQAWQFTSYQLRLVELPDSEIDRVSQKLAAARPQVKR